MQRAFRAVTLTLLTLLVSPAGFALDDAFVGTWKLNLRESKYQSPAPISYIYKYEQAENGSLKVTIRSVDADGKPNTHERTETYDGKPRAVVNDPGAEAVSLKKTDDRTVAGANWKKGKIVTRFTRAVSTDGKTMTVTVDGKNAQGKPFHDVRVFDKQESR
jgi:hypothetical protein